MYLHLIYSLNFDKGWKIFKCLIARRVFNDFLQPWNVTICLMQFVKFELTNHLRLAPKLHRGLSANAAGLSCLPEAVARVTSNLVLNVRETLKSGSGCKLGAYRERETNCQKQPVPLYDWTYSTCLRASSKPTSYIQIYLHFINILRKTATEA